MLQTEKNTAFIKQLAAELGFDHCGIAAATQLDEDAYRLEKWLNKGMHGTMKYMENYFDKRIDLYNLYPLLVHTNLFDGGYSNSVMTILRRFA